MIKCLLALQLNNTILTLLGNINIAQQSIFKQMRKRLIILILLTFILISYTYAINLKDTLKCNYPNRFVIGSNLALLYSNIVDPVSNKKYIDFLYRFEPEFSIYLNLNLGFGVQGIFEHGNNNYSTIPTLYGLGFFIKYYYPIKYKTIGQKDRFKLYCKLSYLRTNYYLTSKKELPIVLDKCKVNVLSVPIGISIRIWRGFHGKIEMRPEFYNPGGNLLICQLGFEYHV